MGYDSSMAFWTQKTPTHGVSTPPHPQFKQQQLDERAHAIQAITYLYLCPQKLEICGSLEDKPFLKFVLDPKLTIRTTAIHRHLKDIAKNSLHDIDSSSLDAAAYPKDLLNQLIQAHSNFLKDQGLIQKLEFTPKDDYLGSLKKLREGFKRPCPTALTELTNALDKLQLDSSHTRPDWQSIQQTMAILSLTTLHQRQLNRWEQRAKKAETELSGLTPAYLFNDISSKIKKLEEQRKQLKNTSSSASASNLESSAAITQNYQHKIETVTKKIESLRASRNFLKETFISNPKSPIKASALTDNSPYIQQLKADLEKLESQTARYTALHKMSPSDFALELAKHELAKKRGSNVKTSVKLTRNLMGAETLVTDDAERQEQKQQLNEREIARLQQIKQWTSNTPNPSQIDIYTPFPGAPDQEYLTQLKTLCEDFYPEHKGEISDTTQNLTLTHTASANEKNKAPNRSFQTVTRYDYKTGQIESTIENTDQPISTQDQLTANIFATYAYAYPNTELPKELNLEVAASFTQDYVGILQTALQDSLAKLVREGEKKTFIVKINESNELCVEVIGIKSIKPTLSSSNADDKKEPSIEVKRTDGSTKGIAATGVTGTGPSLWSTKGPLPPLTGVSVPHEGKEPVHTTTKRGSF